MTQLFPHASNSEVIAAVSSRLADVHLQIWKDSSRFVYFCAHTLTLVYLPWWRYFGQRFPPTVTLEIVWWSFQSPKCFAMLTDVLFSKARTFSFLKVRLWGGNRVNLRHEGMEMRSAGGGERGVSSVSETLCHGLDEEMKCAASIRRWAKIKASPTLSHMVLFDQCFAFSLFSFFSASLSRFFSSFLRAGLLFFSPAEIPPRYWGNNMVARKVRGLRKPNLPQITPVSTTFPPLSYFLALSFKFLFSWSCSQHHIFSYSICSGRCLIRVLIIQRWHTDCTEKCMKAHGHQWEFPRLFLLIFIWFWKTYQCHVV